MNNKQNTHKRYTLKLSINALSICVLSLMVLPIHAEQKATVDIKAAAMASITAAVAAVPRAPNDENNKPEVVVEEIKTAADIKAAAAKIAAVEAYLLLNNKTIKSGVLVERIPADIVAAVEKELLSRIKIEKTEMEDEALQVFRAPIYNVKPKLGYIAVVDGDVLDLNYKGTNAILTDYLTLIKDDFVLDSEEKASLLGNAFHKTYPYKFKKIVKPVKIKTGWIVPLGKFFKNYSGLVFTTDENGKITLVEFSLSINPEDYSYRPVEA